MAIPSQLSGKLRESLGSEAGEDLVTWMDEVAAHHEELRASIRADFAEFRREIRREMKEEIQALESRMLPRFDRLDERILYVDRRIGETKADLMKWSFVFWVGAVAAIAALAGVLR
jgi:hypothetical protein